ncbi:CDP-diacylglycerol--serine O-phosphatidyltransferase [Dokdonella immobilis]|uniref:CDP-diacylglycerol--serine O-phosphatidyltransferase n=1 Tax=Dokdonella immobilis TaxID=578942 RepID=A0A1I4W806_9GAMM|nr:CDP-diacylglycerol--serine O-phosphatidyltransferase [Dokdonella immobilis]SFN09565.1 CDP-diacylglycerol--serine O-phosphatidyltransferase [Dokdonella immobilis]
MEETPTSPRKRPRGIYLLPNLFTTGAMFAGFYAIIAAIGGRYSDAALAVFVAGVLDGLDGRVARLTGTQSDFGVQYDSLSDLVSFGLAPALVMYTWSLSSLTEYGSLWGKIGWAAAFIYAACAAMRLARFNTQVGVADKRYFQGLASPAAAGLCMSFVWTIEKFDMSGLEVQFITPVIAVVAGLLMVSNVRYFSFKAWPTSDRVPFIWIPAALLVFVALAVDPARVLFGIAALYVLSGPVMTLWGLRRWREQRALRHSERSEE